MLEKRIHFINDFKASLVQFKEEIQLRVQADDGPFEAAYLQLISAIIDDGKSSVDRLVAIFEEMSKSEVKLEGIINQIPIPGLSESSIPLISILTLFDQPEKITLLCEQGYDPNQVTINGYTALHFAAICGHLDCYDRLLAYGGDEMQKTDQGLSPLDLKPMRIAPQFPKQGLDIGEVIPSQSQYQQQFQTQYQPQTSYTSDALFRFWLCDPQDYCPSLGASLGESHQEIKQIHEVLAKEYERYIDQVSGPKVKLPFKVAEVSINGKSERGLEAISDIPEGRVFEYAGHFDLNERENIGDRNLKYLSADQWGSGMEFINDSFPNTAFIRTSYKGLPKVLVLVLSPIKKGEMIRIHYGANHPVKKAAIHHEWATKAQIKASLGEFNESMGLDETGFVRYRHLGDGRVKKTRLKSTSSPSSIYSTFLKVMRYQVGYEYLLSTPNTLERCELNDPAFLLFTVKQQFGDIPDSEQQSYIDRIKRLSAK